jgi:hypothetical protein
VRWFREYRTGRSTSNGENRRELSASPAVEAGSTFRSDYLRSSGHRSAWRAARTRRGSDSRCVGPPLRAPGLCDLSRLRLPREDAATAYQHPPRLELGRISAAVGAAEQPPADGSRLLGAPLDHGEGAGLRSEIHDRGDPGTDTCRSEPGRCFWEPQGKTRTQISPSIEVQGCCD